MNTPKPITVALVVPCYNEAARLDTAAFASFDAAPYRLRFRFVNDGSQDVTQAVLERLERENPERVSVLRLPENRGKAEAVRQGLLVELESGAELVGYWDADLATPLSELLAFCDLLRTRPEIEIVLGSRVRLMGRSIERSAVRHYLGRVFATGASLTLGLPVYDTQCGAKLFRATPTLCSVLAEPFRSKWVFDVEILARYLHALRGHSPPAAERIHELPLTRWTDVPGSKVRAFDFLRSGFELIRLRSRAR